MPISVIRTTIPGHLTYIRGTTHSLTHSPPPKPSPRLSQTLCLPDSCAPPHFVSCPRHIQQWRSLSLTPEPVDPWCQCSCGVRCTYRANVEPCRVVSCHGAPDLLLYICTYEASERSRRGGSANIGKVRRRVGIVWMPASARHDLNQTSQLSLALVEGCLHTSSRGFVTVYPASSGRVRFIFVDGVGERFHFTAVGFLHGSESSWARSHYNTTRWSTTPSALTTYICTSSHSIHVSFSGTHACMESYLPLSTAHLDLES